MYIYKYPLSPSKGELYIGPNRMVIGPYKLAILPKVDIHQLLRQLHLRRFLVVRGSPGIGKTALLAELGRFVRLRGEPFEEVRWVDGDDEHLRRLSLFTDADLATVYGLSTPLPPSQDFGNPIAPPR